MREKTPPLTLISTSVHPVLSPNPNPPPQPLHPHSAALLPLHRMRFESGACDAATYAQRAFTARRLIDVFETLPLQRGVQDGKYIDCDWDEAGLPFFDAECEIVLSRPVKDNANMVCDDIAVFVQQHEILPVVQVGIPNTLQPVRDLRPEEAYGDAADLFLIHTFTEGWTICFFANLHHAKDNVAITALVRMVMDTPRTPLHAHTKMNWSTTTDEGSSRLLSFAPSYLRDAIRGRMAFAAKHTHEYKTRWKADGQPVRTVRPYVVVGFQEDVSVYDIVEMFFPDTQPNPTQGEEKDEQQQG